MPSYLAFSVGYVRNVCRTTPAHHHKKLKRYKGLLGSLFIRTSVDVGRHTDTLVGTVAGRLLFTRISKSAESSVTIPVSNSLHRWNLMELSDDTLMRAARDG